MKRRVLWAALLVMAALLGMVPAVMAADQPVGKVYLLVIDKLSIHDLSSSDTPSLYRLAGDGAVGLQSNRTLGTGTSEDGAVTLGAGNLARADNYKIQAYNVGNQVTGRNQTAEEYYTNLTGKPLGNNSIVVTSLPRLQKLLDGGNVNTSLGALGETLVKNGHSVCVIGNGDFNGDLSRLGAVIGMDGQGRVRYGDVGTRTEEKVRDSYVNIQTNYTYINKNLTTLSRNASLVVVELSDLARWEKAEPASPSIAAAERKKLLFELDYFVGNLRSKVSDNDLIMVVSPSAPAAGAEMKDTFTPVIIYGPGYESGLLYSPATRRDMIVANTDIAPTILQYFNLPIPSEKMIGRGITAKSNASGDQVKQAQSLAADTAVVNRMRAPLVKGYVVLQIAIIILALLAVLAFPKLRRWVLPLVISLVVIPLVLLLAPLLPVQGESQYISLVIVLSILMTWLGYFAVRGRHYRVFLLMSLITMAILDVDILTGTNLIKSSVLGYDPMVGARYYGIGNEYLGVFLGTSIIAGVIIFRRLPPRWAVLAAAAFFIFQTWLVASPQLGAQSDGVITVPLAFAVALVLLAGWKFSWRTLAVIGLLIIAMISGLAAYDLSRPPSQQTHIGRAAGEVVRGGMDQAFTIIGRKLGMNLKLIRYTIWSRVFIVILASLAVLLYWPAGAMLRIKERYPHLFKGFAGILTGAVVGGTINDSGIVVAATTSIYLVTPVLLLIIKDNLIHPVHLIQETDEGD